MALDLLPDGRHSAGRDRRESRRLSATAAEVGAGEGQGLRREALPQGVRLVERGAAARQCSGAAQRSLSL